MQLHIGAARNLSSILFASYGPDAGCDAIGDVNIGEPVHRFLDMLHAQGSLPKIIAYTLNPRDNALLQSILGSFAAGCRQGALQYGPAWWFADTRDGIERNLESVSSMGLLGTWIGMVTDSRSLLSAPRHEYFRRIFCNFLGTGIDRGEIPCDLNTLAILINKVCFRNAVEFLGAREDLNGRIFIR